MSMKVVEKIAVTAAALSADPRQAAAAARKIGIRGVLFDAVSPAFSVPDLSQTGRREFRQMLSANECELVGLRVDLGPKGLSSKSDVDQQLRRIEKAMEAAQGLNTPQLCIDLGPLPTPSRSQSITPKVSPELAGLIIIPTPSDVAPPEPDESQTPADVAYITHLDPIMIELGQRADRMGVMIAFRSELSSVAALERAILAARCPWFGVDIDPVALLRDSMDYDDFFSRVGPVAQHVRARDANAGSGHRTQPTVVGFGGVNWPHLLANLESTGFRGWITLDPVELQNRMAGAVEGAQYLRGLK